MSEEREADHKIDESTFLTLHRPQLESSDVPQRYWTALYTKLNGEVYDAGDKFQMIQEDKTSGDDGPVVGHNWSVRVFCEDGLKKDDPDNIFLIDHAWTCYARDARMCLEKCPNLLDRMEILMELAFVRRNCARVDHVLEEMWKYNQTYKFGNFDRGSEAAQPMWYILDEFGSRIQHSDKPSFRLVPFFYSPLEIAFSLLWPLQDLAHGDEVTRDYVESVRDPLIRQARLLPWRPSDMRSISFQQTEPGLEYFQEYKVGETLPSEDFEFQGLPVDRKVRVYMEYEVMAAHLTDERFELVTSEDEADIIWTHKSYKDYRKLSELNPGKLINQFPCESVVCVKDLLAIVSRRAAPSNQSPCSLEPGPKWLPVTYNLQTELPKFVSYFQHREDQSLDNHWICKPWNLARGLDMHITNNLNHIVRLPESGPKVACKYVEDPVLYDRADVGRVKFDIRYMVLLRSVRPLKLFAYNVFWLRFANEQFSLDNLDNYQKHFTVMNYKDPQRLKQVNYDEFIPQFEKQYPDHPWLKTEERIFAMLRELFQAATAKPPPLGIAPSPQSRAIYAVDFLLGWETDSATGERFMQPKLCEVNFCPDCDRACKYHPHFTNDILSVLFLDDTEDKNVTRL